jgi:putative DNA primase/helicase
MRIQDWVGGALGTPTYSRFNHVGPERFEPFQKGNAMANSNGTKQSPVTQLVRLVEGAAELFRDQRGRPHCAVGWYSFPLDQKSDEVVAYLRRQYSVSVSGWISRDETRTAIEILQTKARSGPVRDLFVRVGYLKHDIVLDLGNDSGQVVVVRPNGWTVGATPVKFRRPQGLGPLPVPSIERGSLRQELAPVVGYLPPADQVLLMAWLLGTLNSRIPQPLLELTGLQGSAKTSLTNALRSCVDPSLVLTRQLPSNIRDTFIAAYNTRILAFDNVSAIPNTLSDALCSIATGGGYATRKLWADEDEALFQVRCPVILNGIHEVVTRPDLRDRAITVSLPVIEPACRILDSECSAQFFAARPRILAALLDAAAAALGLQDSVKPANLPRMADWYLFAFAAAHHEAFGFSPAEFEAAYQANRQDSVDMAIDSCLIARPLLDILFMHGSWEGTTTDLLAELANRVDVNMPKSPEWPRTPEALSHELKRIESNLRTQGVEIQRSRDSITRARKLMIRQRQ